MEVADVQMTLSAFSDQPLYNIKAVCIRTGISAAALRAWERRHGLPSPNRTEQGYRLYSERDVAILFWLMQQLKAGITIGQAAHQLHNLVDSGQDPEVRIPPLPLLTNSLVEQNKPRSPELLRQELVEAFVQLDERAAEDLLTEAGALYTPETLLIDIFQAAFHELHEQPNLPGMVTHFALNYARQRLVSMTQITPAVKSRRNVITMGFSNERNEIDSLILGVLLRRHGWPVVYLGSDLDPHMLGAALSNMNAGIVVFYVDDPINAARLTELTTPMDAAGKPIRITVGGHALQLAPALREKIKADYLGTDIRVIVKSITEWLALESENGAVPSHEI